MKPELENWQSLNAAITKLGEKECLELIDIESSNRKRLQVLLRIHSRLNKVRAKRERQELRSLAN